MAVRAIDKNGDWMFGNGMSDYRTDLEEIKQNILTVLRSWKNDCFFDLDAGVDWKSYLGSFGRDEDIKNDVVDNVLKVEGVVSVEKYEAFVDENRTIHLQITVNTIYGITELEY